MSVVLCQSSRCFAIGAHTPDCGSESCRGCSPREAAPGMNLCWTHHDQLPRLALRAGEVWVELLLQLAGSGSAMAEATSGTKDVGLSLNPRAVACRDRTEDVLRSWTRLVIDERGGQPPPDHPESTSGFLARNATWLAAHPLAGPCFDELFELAYGEPWRVAFPSGTRVRVVGACPLDGCEGDLRAILRRADSLLPSEITCSTSTSHRWGYDQWLTLARQLDLVAA